MKRLFFSFCVLLLCVASCTSAQIPNNDYFIVSRDYSGVSLNSNRLEVTPPNKNDINAQIWTLTKRNDGYIITNSTSSTKVLQAVNAEEDGIFNLEEPSNSDKDVWILVPEGDKFYLRNKATNLFLTISDYGDYIGLGKYKKATGLNQKFYLLPADDDVIDYSSFLKPIENNIDNLTKQYTVNSVPNAKVESIRMNRYAPCDYYPAGLWVEKGEKITFNASNLNDLSNDFKILIGEPNEWFDFVETNEPYLYIVKNGVNSFTSTRSGLMYFQYTNHNFQSYENNPVSIKITLGGKQSPIYVVGKTTASQWTDQLKSTSPKVQIIGKKGMVTVNRITFNEKSNLNLDASSKKLDDVVTLCNTLAGYDNSSFRNMATPLKTHYVEDNISKSTTYKDGVLMYAGNYFVGMQSYSIFELLDANLLQKEWAIWHETGHLYQPSDMTWPEIVEVSVNIFSLFIQEKFGNPNRLNNKNEGKSNLEYAKDFLNDPKAIFQDDKYSEQMVWIRLVMFEQLRKQFGDAFYSNLFQYYRANPLNPALIDDQNRYKIQQFIIRSSIVSKTNLSDFFKKWKMPISTETTAAIQKMNLKNPTVDISRTLLSK